ncbi:DUF1572 family protein [Deminuibacter soli]|uniref:DUF1572 domain-containing protein n=1 Tax=Deminuibacter soli TaxID=2291815 RepID=A0A3E1NCM3_9BACT|nr:DUF1572 family protein [Deminuibacter soli]RFM25577.1 DUF1572 domain-containing protein [Deminuibacter soli]
MQFEEAFIKDIHSRFKTYKEMGDKALLQLDEAQLHFRPSPESNSIAIIVQHMYGNMLSRFTNFLTEDGEKHWRKRDAEFEAAGISRQDLLSFWNAGWECLLGAVTALQPENLMQTITIRSEPHLVYDALLRQLAHHASHVGQIITLGKMQKDAAWVPLSIAKGQSEAFKTKPWKP